MSNEYPSNWHEIAAEAKDAAGWKCERCGHRHDATTGHVLTVHHLVPDKGLCEPWNLAVLCQRSHLVIQGRVDMKQRILFPDLASEWFKPHLEGYECWINRFAMDRPSASSSTPGASSPSGG